MYTNVFCERAIHLPTVVSDSPGGSSKTHKLSISSVFFCQSFRNPGLALHTRIISLVVRRGIRWWEMLLYYQNFELFQNCSKLHPCRQSLQFLRCQNLRTAHPLQLSGCELIWTMNLPIKQVNDEWTKSSINSINPDCNCKESIHGSCIRDCDHTQLIRINWV